MSKEALKSPYANLVFRETFRSEQILRQNGGVPTAVTFANGVGTFTVATTTKVQYPSLNSGTYSIRIRFNRLVIDLGYLFDFRGAGPVGAGFAYIKAGTGVINVSSGTPYVNGVASGTATTSTKEIIISGLTVTRGGDFFVIGNRYDNSYAISADIDLVEIYKGTLTASEIANLYNNKWNKEESVLDGQATTNKLINGDFATGTLFGWGNSEGGVTVVGNKAVFIGTNATERLTQAVVTYGSKYLLTFTISDYVAGRIMAQAGGNGTPSPNYNANGTYSTVLTNNATAAITAFYLLGQLNFVGKISNVLLQEIQPDLLLDFDTTKGTLTDKNGKVTFTPESISFKKIGQKYSANFDGLLSKITCNSDFIGSKAVTICGWFKNRTYGEGSSLVRGYILDNSRIGIVTHSTDNKLGLSSDYSTVTYSANNSISLNTWQFFAITRKLDGKGTFYIGKLDTAPALSGVADANTGVPATGATNVIIGNRSTQDRTFDGVIPMIKVYEGILDLETITRIWSETRVNLI